MRVDAGQVAIVTGASSGIGRAIAFDLADQGANVIVVGRRAELLHGVAEECRRRGGARSRPAVLDVSDRATVETTVAEVLDGFGRVDILINNAGQPARIHATRLRPEDVERTMQVNFLGAVYATLAALPSMIERRRGHVVNVASVAARIGSPREAAYTASKFALAGWSEVLAGDLAGTGVRIHLVNPGPIETEIWSKLQEPAAYHGKFIPPERVAAAVRSCLATGSFERWVPRAMRALVFAHDAAPGLYVRAIGRWDRRAERTRR